METLTLEIPEAQVIRWIRQLSPAGKQAALKALVPRLNDFESRVDYGERQIQTICAERGLKWEGMTESERERLVDTLLHEA
jgi:hypothetical protein